MNTPLISPARSIIWGIPSLSINIAILAIGLLFFTYIVIRRVVPLIKANPDYRTDRVELRLTNVFKLWFCQYRQPRYLVAGVLHILLFLGFLVVSIRTISFVILGIYEDFVLPGFDGNIGHIYNLLKDYAATIVFISSVVALIRRKYFKPSRYAVSAEGVKDHSGEAVLVLALIAILMVSESFFEASNVVAQGLAGDQVELLAPYSMAWLVQHLLSSTTTISVLQGLHTTSYLVHDLIFFGFLCFLPMGKHFHVLTSLFNVFFMKLDKGTIKPVKWGVPDTQLDEVDSFGVKHFNDFTWKHMLDFYSCADCGRCSDQCPANIVGRPLSPRFITIKARDFAFSKYSLNGTHPAPEALIGTIFSEDEIWSCTTCGACEEECPLMIEYIDKIVDLRRGMVDEGHVPQSLQKPLSALEKRGNPYGKMEKKRADWATKDNEFKSSCEVKLLENGETVEALFFVDSISSYDDRIIKITQSTAKVLTAVGIDFGVLGKREKDSGHEVRRFGEEMLFQSLKEENSAVINATGASRIVTADPHTLNALAKDYQDIPPVHHISEIIWESVQAGKLKLQSVAEPKKVYTYHDPCYLGRHNGIYDVPRNVLDAIPDLKRIEMNKCRDRSFCCGGGGLMLYYEPIEETRMGKVRVEMAKDAGADVIVTACPFCLVNIEDAIKTCGLEGKMEVIDLVELVAKQIQ